MNVLLDQACEAAQTLSARDKGTRWVVGNSDSHNYIVVHSLDSAEADGLPVWACYENGKYVRLAEAE